MAQSKMKWDGEADQQLLLSILATHTINLNHAAIAERIGPHCTPRAVVERIKKLKKMSKDGGFDKAGGGAPKTSRATGPSSKRKNITPDDTPSPKKVKTDNAKLEEDSEESYEIKGITNMNVIPEYSAAYENEGRKPHERDLAYDAIARGVERTTRQDEPRTVSNPTSDLLVDRYAYEPLDLYGHHDDMLIPFENEQ
ncbi:hypothetical protein FGG08_007347 [Glutinoglossum americanum]|uniref:Uncharacterized protein n=1 Tax=Glutinoglossum americanum TaxID=1670608 RepID=A0A9P8HZ15_9PEZI|nr:hypothetical protein FGG08_007347 [Glutinoglossum americanum]